MRVAMIGTGYVGLVSGACFADFGHVVTCIDKDPRKISRLLAGEIPIYEPGLDDLVARNVREGRLSFTLEGAKAIKDADAVFIAVGTPTRRGDGHADLSYVYAAAREIAAALGRLNYDTAAQVSAAEAVLISANETGIPSEGVLVPQRPGPSSISVAPFLSCAQRRLL